MRGIIFIILYFCYQILSKLFFPDKYIEHFHQFETLKYIYTTFLRLCNVNWIEYSINSSAIIMTDIVVPKIHNGKPSKGGRDVHN